MVLWVVRKWTGFVIKVKCINESWYSWKQTVRYISICGNLTSSCIVHHKIPHVIWRLIKFKVVFPTLSSVEYYCLKPKGPFTNCETYFILADELTFMQHFAVHNKVSCVSYQGRVEIYESVQVCLCHCLVGDGSIPTKITAVGFCTCPLPYVCQVWDNLFTGY